MKYIFIASLVFLTLFCKAQSVPQIFEPGLISNGGVFGLTISPDATIALWVSSNGKRDTLKIMESRKNNGIWSAPVVASFSSANGAWKDIDPVFSPDGKTVLFQSNRNTIRNSDRKDFDIWAVTLSDGQWSKPQHLGTVINTESSESYASMATNGNIYFMKENEDGKGRSDIYVSVFKNGSYQTPVNIGLPINTGERESNPFISPGENYIIYFSSDVNGFGDTDLYISFKKKGKWTTPKNMGAAINSGAAEFCPFVHKQEKRLYFTRQVKQGDRMLENLYYINFNAKKYK